MTIRIAPAMVVGLLVLAGCSRTETPKFVPEPDPCLNDAVDCGDNPSVECDARDVTCKCGPVENGLVCPEGAVCTPQGGNEFTCLSARCELVSCERGMSCDPDSGTCTCGGVTCSADQRCEGGICTPPRCEGVTCHFGLSCDPADGVCKCAGTLCADDQACAEGRCVLADRCDPIFGIDCGFSGTCDRGHCICADGAACAAGTWCVDQSCQIDHCVGVNICAYPTSCDPSDGQCHCTGKGGRRTGAPACGAAVCEEDGTCSAVDPCRDVSCSSPGAVCDPSPDPNVGGVCRCGGYGLEHPKCYSTEGCDQEGNCRGVGCQGVKCDINFPGTTCDPDDGFCKCGGAGGTRCQLGDVCLPVTGNLACAPQCDPLAGACSDGDSCYFDPTHVYSVCLPSGHAAEGDPCQALNDCAPGLSCLPGGHASTCARTCDPLATGTCPAGEVCVALDFYPKLGACIPSR